MNKKRGLFIVLMLSASLLIGCGVSAGPVVIPGGPSETDDNNDDTDGGDQPSSVINSPSSGSTYGVGDDISIQSTSTDQTGVTRVDLLVNDSVVASDSTPGSTPQLQYSLIQHWMPDQPGTFTITVIAYRSDETAGLPASISLVINGDGSITTYTDTPTATLSDGLNVTATYTYTPTATTEGAQSIATTPTYTPSYTPTTQPAAQLAPEDANFNNPLNIPLDSTASVTDFISYPDGDTVDRVRWDISGMNQNPSLSGGRARLILAVSCFGTNIEQVQFFTGGQTYTCGQTIVDQEVTYDSRTGQVTITAIGGEGTYVQWVLTGTATRTN